MLIKLNETREKLSETVKRTSDFEQAFIELHEDMEAEREETALEEERLKRDINETLEKMNEQKKLNLVKKVEAEDTRMHQSSNEADLERKKDNVSHHEANLSRLEALLKQQTEQRDNDAERNIKLAEMSKTLLKNHEELTVKYADEKRNLDKELSALITNKQTAQNEYDQLQTQKVRTMNLLDAATLSGRKDKDEAEEMQKSLRHAKDDLLHQTSECTRLRRENIELESVIERTIQDHIATADLLNKQIQEYQSLLLTERKERQILQSKRDEINKEISDYTLDFNKFVAKTTRGVNEAKALHQKQNEKGQEVQKLLKEAEHTIKVKQEELLGGKTKYLKMQKSLKGKVKVLKDSISNLKNELQTRTEKFEKDLPEFEELKEFHARKIDEYERMKKFIVEVKTEKKNIEETIESKQSKLEEMEQPKLKVQEELALARAEYLQQLKTEAQDMREIEKDIYECSQKYNAVQGQNERFRKAIKFFEDDISFMSGRMKEMHDGKHDIDVTIGQYRDWLEMQWRKHMDLDKEYHDHDVLLLDDIKKVERSTSVRERKVETIHSRLEDELNILTKFIDKVAEFRPKADVT